MVEENKLYFRNGWKIKVTRTLNVFVGHSPGIGYPSSCFIPDKHKKCHSEASNLSNPKRFKDLKRKNNGPVNAVKLVHLFAVICKTTT